MPHTNKLPYLVSILIVVDLPAPLGPINATLSPLFTLKEISSTALISLISGEKRFLIHPEEAFFTGNENFFESPWIVIESDFMTISRFYQKYTALYQYFTTFNNYLDTQKFLIG